MLPNRSVVTYVLTDACCIAPSAILNNINYVIIIYLSDGCTVRTTTFLSNPGTVIIRCLSYSCLVQSCVLWEPCRVASTSILTDSCTFRIKPYKLTDRGIVIVSTRVLSNECGIIRTLLIPTCMVITALLIDCCIEIGAATLRYFCILIWRPWILVYGNRIWIPICCLGCRDGAVIY